MDNPTPLGDDSDSEQDAADLAHEDEMKKEWKRAGLPELNVDALPSSLALKMMTLNKISELSLNCCPIHVGFGFLHKHLWVPASLRATSKGMLGKALQQA